jgi:two-component system chemotaxis response regulator CheB
MNRPDKTIRVLVVDDSRVVAELLTHVLSSDERIRVVGVAADGEAAVEAAQRLKPDVITMDIHMPRLDGFEATRRIMETCPVPIVILSGSTSPDEIAANFRVVEAGAVAVLSRPHGPANPNHAKTARELIETVKLMSEVKVVRRWPRSTAAASVNLAPRSELVRRERSIRVVAIGASTGGPIALQTILSGLPATFPVPVLIVQHMTPGFAPGFVEWLTRSCGFPVRIATEGEGCLPGVSYVAPDGFHMGIRPGNRVLLSRDPAESGLRPSVSFLFRSVQETFGSAAAAVLLTGMGQDGAAELKRLREAGAVTIAQDESSSVVYGMPKQAALIGAALHVQPPQDIARTLTALVGEA